MSSWMTSSVFAGDFGDGVEGNDGFAGVDCVIFVGGSLQCPSACVLPCSYHPREALIYLLSCVLCCPPLRRNDEVVKTHRGVLIATSLCKLAVAGGRRRISLAGSSMSPSGAQCWLNSSVSWDAARCRVMACRPTTAEWAEATLLTGQLATLCSREQSCLGIAFDAPSFVTKGSAFSEVGGCRWESDDSRG